MMNTKDFKIYCSNGQVGYANWLIGTNRYNPEFKGTLVSSMKNANLLILTGGSDISTELYSEKDTQGSVGKNIKRDLEEVMLAGYAIKNNIPILGICRGAQMLCVLAGGKLIQDMTHHHEHKITIFNNKAYDCSENEISVNSLHHQLQYPFNIKEKNDYMMIAAAYTNLGVVDTGDSNDINLATLKRKGEPEIVYYKKLNGLGIQFHPEMLYNRSVDHVAIKFLHSCIKKTILNGKL